MEIWKDIKNFEDYYEISNLGRVRRKEGYVNVDECISPSGFRRVKQRILKLDLKKNGYLQVNLHANNKSKQVSVHKLVAIAFIENDDPENKTQVNHKNCNKQDNRVENLEWVTPEENRKHAKENNRYFSNRKKRVKCKENGLIFESSYHAAEYVNNTYFNNSKQVKNIANKIRAVCSGKRNIAYGFTWEQCM